MSKMSEIDMMVQEVITYVRQDGYTYPEALAFVIADWALDTDEANMVEHEVLMTVYNHG